MDHDTRNFLEAQKASAHNPTGSHQARSRGLAINTARRTPNIAISIAEQIESNLDEASDVSGFHPDSCLRLAAWLRDWRKAL